MSKIQSYKKCKSNLVFFFFSKEEIKKYIGKSNFYVRILVEREYISM